jgi:hypothetical protein
MTAATLLGTLGAFETAAAPEEAAAGPIGWAIGGAILLAIGGLAIAAAMESSNQTHTDAPPSGTQPCPLADPEPPKPEPEPPKPEPLKPPPPVLPPIPAGGGGGGDDDGAGGGGGKGGGGRNFKRLSKGEIKKLQDHGIDPHDLKPKYQGSRYDLFKDENGDIVVLPKNGVGEPQPTGYNINNL